MNDLVSILGLLIAASVLLMMAFPRRVAELIQKKSRKVGCTYWGVYEGAATEETDTEKLIEIKEPSAKERITAGSTMYALGRGTSFRQ